MKQNAGLYVSHLRSRNYGNGVFTARARFAEFSVMLHTWFCNVCGAVREATNPRLCDQLVCATVADHEEGEAARNTN